MTGLAVFLGKELREHWRTRRLLVLAIVFVAFGIGSPLLARFTPELIATLTADEGLVIDVPPPTLADAVAQFVRNLGQTGVLAAILLAMGSVAGEKERGTAALWLTKPLSRGAFLGAKAAGLAAVLGIGVLGAGIGGFAYTALLFETPQIAGWVAACVLLLLQMSAYAAVTFLGSTLTRSPLAAAGIGIGLLVAIAVVGALPVIGAWTPAGLAEAALAVGSASDVPESAWRSVIATLALIATALAIAGLAFRRQEL
jgi:ABC-2 type transport system permease protein